MSDDALRERSPRRQPCISCGWAVLALAAATLQAQEPRSLDVVLNEIAWMGTLKSASDEWIELFNNSGADIDLGGWTLSATDGTPTIALSGIIPPGGHFLLERTDDSTVLGVSADQIYTGGLTNSGEVLELRDDCHYGHGLKGWRTESHRQTGSKAWEEVV